MKKAAQKKKRVSRISSKMTSSRGTSKILLIAIVAIVLAIGGGIYVLSQNGSLKNVIPLAKTPLNPNCEYNDPELCKFMNNYVNMPTSYSVTSTGNYGGESTESVYEVDGDGKFHMSAKQNGKEVSNMISIDDTTYMLDYADNKWWKMTSQPVETMEEDKAEEVAFDPNEVEDNTTYKFVTKEACGDRTCFKYEVVTPGMEGKSFIWFDDKDYLMRRMRMEDADGMFSESIYTYKGVSITAPSPVKEGNPYGTGSGSGYSEEEARKMMEQYQQSSGSDDSSMYESETPIEDSSAEGF